MGWTKVKKKVNNEIQDSLKLMNIQVSKWYLLISKLLILNKIPH